MDAIQTTFTQKVDDAAKSKDPYLMQVATNSMTLVKSSMGNPKTTLTAAFEQLSVPNLRKILDVANGNNKDQKIRIITNAVYAAEMAAIKSKITACEAVKEAMEESVKYVTMNQYGNDKAIINWSACASDVLDIISRKERAAGAAEASKQVVAATASAADEAML